MALLGRVKRRDEDLEAAFGEFDHYVGELPRDREKGSVSGGFTAPDDPRDVIGYYTERLRNRGWRVERAEDEVGLVRVTGRRGNLEYHVSFEEGDGVEWRTFAQSRPDTPDSVRGCERSGVDRAAYVAPRT